MVVVVGWSEHTPCSQEFEFSGLLTSAPAGSVFIQDSRMWHSTACHNTSGQVRVAGQNRWIPWWFNAQYGGGEDGYGVTGWINREDLEAMPPDLQPLFSHLCVEVS